MNDLISRQDALDTLNVDAELLRRVLDDADVVGAERAKYEWGLGLIESYISDMKELPPAQTASKWVFCKDKPPEEEGWYLCATTALTKPRKLYFYPSTGKWIDNIRQNMFDLYKIYGKITGELVTEENESVDWTDQVTAWMPLPAIPKKEEQDG